MTRWHAKVEGEELTSRLSIAKWPSLKINIQVILYELNGIYLGLNMYIQVHV